MKTKLFFNLMIIGIIVSFGFTSCSDDDKEIDVTGITLSTNSIVLEKGSTAQITVTAFSPTDATKKTISWTSSNTAIATVDNTGKVSGISTGFSTITATAQSGITVNCELAVYDDNLTQRLAWEGITSDSIVLNMQIGQCIILIYDEQMNLVHKINNVNTPISVAVPQNGFIKSTNPMETALSLESQQNLSHLDCSNNAISFLKFYVNLNSLVCNNCPNLNLAIVDGATLPSDVHSDVLNTLQGIADLKLVVNNTTYKYIDGAWTEVQQ